MHKQTITETRTINQRGLLGASYVCCFWGDEAELHKFLQAYACERVKSAARTKGHTVTESRLGDGSVKLSISAGGGAL